MQGNTAPSLLFRLWFQWLINNPSHLNTGSRVHTETDKKPTYFFEGIHFCTEVGGFQHAQQNVQPQVIDRRDQVRLEAHTQQFDPRQELRDTHQSLFETKQQKRDK